MSLGWRSSAALAGHITITMPTLFAVTIDTEEGFDWNAGLPVKWYSLDNIREVPRFEELCANHGARTTWFVNWSVMNDEFSRETMLEVAQRPGVELGMHIHPWLTPPHDEEGDASGHYSYLANQKPDRVYAKLQSIYELFEREGSTPTSFRGGRYSSGGPIHQFLRDKAFAADSSVVPFRTWRDDGAPDYRDRDLMPLRHDPDADEEPLWEIPLTIAFTRWGFRRWANRFDKIEYSWLGKARMIGILARLGIVKRVWLSFDHTSAADMFDLLRVLRPMKLPCVTFSLHSSSLRVGGNPYSANEEDVERIWSNVDEVLGVVASWSDFEPATITEIAQQLEAEYQYGHCPVHLQGS